MDRRRFLQNTLAGATVLCPSAGQPVTAKEAEPLKKTTLKAGHQHRSMDADLRVLLRTAYSLGPRSWPKLPRERPPLVQMEAGGSHGQKLTSKQESVIAVLLTEPTYAAAAKKAGNGETTLYRWLKLPDFRAAYDEARRELVKSALAASRPAPSRPSRRFFTDKAMSIDGGH